MRTCNDIGVSFADACFQICLEARYTEGVAAGEKQSTTFLGSSAAYEAVHGFLVVQRAVCIFMADFFFAVRITFVVVLERLFRRMDAAVVA
jgi:hypothetical protein